MKKFFLLLLTYAIIKTSLGQNVGIGTTTPNPKAALEVKATDKGILFPRLSSAQRNAIVDPPDGLHLYNTDERCLNYYDSLFQVWNCYSEIDTCRTITIHIIADAQAINFNTAYASQYPGKTKFVIRIKSGVTIFGAPAIDFSTTPNLTEITIINHGNILGAGGGGGAGATGHAGGPCSRAAAPGGTGGPAIQTLTIKVTVNNYGLIAGGGGGGGGGGRNVIGEYGGGGGGGAGAVSNGGTGGGITFSAPFGGCGTSTVIAQSGQPGTVTTGGAGGLGANGAGAGNGGRGGDRGQAGQNGTGTAAGTGGNAGKAISSGLITGNIINNIGGGQSYGPVD